MRAKPTNPSSTSPSEPSAVDDARLALLYQLLETEMGGVQVYRTALLCAINAELRTEWTRFLAETERHVRVARDLLSKLGLDPDAELPARVTVRHNGDALVKLMLQAMASGTEAEAQLVACECVVAAETKDHQNWSLVGKLADATGADHGAALRAAYELVEPDEDLHLANAQAWCKTLWSEALGLEVRP